MASVNIVSALGVDNPLKTAQRVVIKIGSALLVDAESGQLRTGWLKALAKDIAAQKQQRYRLIRRRLRRLSGRSVWPAPTKSFLRLMASTPRRFC